MFVRRFKSNQFQPEISFSYISSYIWMDYLMQENNVTILHKLNNNNKKVRIGPYLMDGYCLQSKIVYEFNGCVFHQ